MTIWNTGSVSEHIGTLIGWSNIPTGVSGTTMNTCVEQAINHANNFAADNITTTNIQSAYQPAIIDLSISKILGAISMSEGGVDSVKLGDLSVAQGGASNKELANEYWTKGLKQLKELGRKVRYTRVVAG